MLVVPFGSSPRARGTPDSERSTWIVPRFIPACAGNTRRKLPVATRWGSSPRARGTQVAGLKIVPGNRFIPACAGNTHECPNCHVAVPVHPRVRGEHGADHSLLIRHAGSSPRARGTPVAYLWSKRSRRFIPACAGNTSSIRAEWALSSVHPRVRGEHGDVPLAHRAGHGSSPRARGTLERNCWMFSSEWFIPACAGNTASARSTSMGFSVHPRVRGEHEATGEGGAAAFGSSPRARGTRGPPRSRIRNRRFIPACAGNTVGRSCTMPLESVHPRVRGEHIYAYGHFATALGSSPRARGTRSAYPICTLRQRFIPACAGNTTTRWKNIGGISVHPRVRGEHGKGGHLSARRVGSSPRARGTRHRLRHAPH